MILRKIARIIVVILVMGGVFFILKETMFNPLSQGRNFYKYFNYEGAKQAFQKVLKKDPENLQAHLYLFVINSKEGDRESAREHLLALEDYLKNPKGNKGLYKDLGLAFYLNGDYDEAFRFFSLAFKNYSHDYEPLFYMGLCKSLKNLPEEAIKYYQKVLEINPHHMFSLWNIAVLYERKGLYEEAVKYWKKYLEIAPSVFQTSLIRRRIKEIEEGIYPSQALRIKKGG